MVGSPLRQVEYISIRANLAKGTRMITSLGSTHMRPRRRTLAVGLAAAVAVLLSACASTTTTSSSTPALISSGQASAIAAREAQLLNRPTTIPYLGPKITNSIPANKTVYAINCGQSGCDLFTQVAAEAAGFIGWHVKDIETDGTPQQLADAWAEVIREKPFAAIVEGSPMSEVGTYVKEAVANGTVVVADGIPDQAGTDGLIGSVSDSTALGVDGHYMATWVADQLEQTRGSGNTLFLNLPDFPVLQGIKADFESSMAQYCSKCSISTLNVGLSGLQNAPNQTVSYLRAHPNVQYLVISALNAFDSVAPAVRTAGLGVKIIGAIPSATSLSQLRSGTLNATIATSDYEEAYLAMDFLVRDAAGLKSEIPQIQSKYEAPGWILTKQNVPSANIFPIFANIADQYKTVWGA
jgi:ribose transport system substrate-binding protein